MGLDRIYKVPGEGQWARPIEVIDAAFSPESYRIKAICMNCKWEGQVRLLRGVQARRVNAHECPACACQTIRMTKLAGRDSADNDSRDAMEKHAERMERYFEQRRGFGSILG